MRAAEGAENAEARQGRMAGEGASLNTGDFNGTGGWERAGIGRGDAENAGAGQDRMAVRRAGRGAFTSFSHIGHNRTMASRLIPLFPLNVVVFPRTQLPLHIFEDRYKEMVGEAIRDSSEFGIVLAKDDGIVNAGCTVAVEKVLQMFPDGRMDILAQGKRRFEIQSLNEEKTFLQGEVTFFDDEEFAPVPVEVRQLALDNYHELSRLSNAREHSSPDLSDPQLSFQLAQAVPDLDFLNGLLRQRSENGRLKEFNTFLAEYIPRQRTIERMRQLAPTNGFGGKHVEL